MYTPSLTSALLLLASTLPLNLAAPSAENNVPNPFYPPLPNVYLLRVKSSGPNGHLGNKRYVGIRESGTQQRPVLSLHRSKKHATQIHMRDGRQHFVYGNEKTEDWSLMLTRNDSRSDNIGYALPVNKITSIPGYFNYGESVETGHLTVTMENFYGWLACKNHKKHIKHLQLFWQAGVKAGKERVSPSGWDPVFECATVELEVVNT